MYIIVFMFYYLPSHVSRNIKFMLMVSFSPATDCVDADCWDRSFSFRPWHQEHGYYHACFSYSPFYFLFFSLSLFLYVYIYVYIYVYMV